MCVCVFVFEEGETRLDFLLFVSFCVSASAIVADGHILSYSKRMSDKNNNNHNMALKQCFVLRDDIHKKTHQFFLTLLLLLLFVLFSHWFRHWCCGLLSFACSNNTGLICNIPMNAIFIFRLANKTNKKLSISNEEEKRFFSLRFGLLGAATTKTGAKIIFKTIDLDSRRATTKMRDTTKNKSRWFFPFM